MTPVTSSHDSITTPSLDGTTSVSSSSSSSSDDQKSENNDIQSSLTSSSYIYRDFSQHSDDVIAHLHGITNSDVELSTTKRNGCNNPFPVKLHYMLSEVEKDGLDHIVSWQPHGRCFVVRNQKEFVKQILPCWFSQSKISSFQRQLNLYGFRRLTTGTDKGGYCHEYFLRGRPKLCQYINRTKIKGTGARKPSSPESEPNFYLMSYLPKDASSAECTKTTATTTDAKKDTPNTEGGNGSTGGVCLQQRQQQQQQELAIMSALANNYYHSLDFFTTPSSRQLPLMAFINNATIGTIANCTNVNANNRPCW